MMPNNSRWRSVTHCACSSARGFATANTPNRTSFSSNGRATAR